jgi:hypothetical protein
VCPSVGLKQKSLVVSSQDFDPDDMTELEGIFAQMIADNEEGYVMEFIISKLAAKELLAIWDNAMFGDPTSIQMCLVEYGKIMQELSDAVFNPDEE